MIRAYLAKRDLAQRVAREKAHNADYRARRDRALTPSRRSHIEALLAGYVRERSNG